MLSTGSGKSLAPLTAYVLIALLTNNPQINPQVIANAIACINKAGNSTNSYTSTIIAYALILAGDSNAKNAVLAAYSRVIADASLKSSLLVESLAYLLFAMLRMPNPDKSIINDLKKRIISLRNSNGIYYATQVR